MPVLGQRAGRPGLVSVELLEAVLLYLETDVSAAKELNRLLDMHVIFRFDAGIAQYLVARSGMLAPVVQHIELVQARVYAARQMKIEFDHSRLGHDFLLADQAVIGGGCVGQRGDGAVSKGIVPVHGEQLRRVGRVQFLVDAGEGVVRSGRCGQGRRQIVLQSQRSKSAARRSAVEEEGQTRKWRTLPEVSRFFPASRTSRVAICQRSYCDADSHSAIGAALQNESGLTRTLAVGEVEQGVEKILLFGFSNLL